MFLLLNILVRAIYIRIQYFYAVYLFIANISFLGTVQLSILGTNVFYNNCLYMRSMIIYNILNTQGYLLVHPYPIYYIFLLYTVMVLLQWGKMGHCLVPWHFPVYIEPLAPFLLLITTYRNTFFPFFLLTAFLLIDYD